MDIEKLRKVAEGMENALLEKLALKEIGDYSIEVVADDNKIEIYYPKLTPLKCIEATFTCGGTNKFSGV